jgi:hypothetical protein
MSFVQRAICKGERKGTRLKRPLTAYGVEGFWVKIVI